LIQGIVVIILGFALYVAPAALQASAAKLAPGASRRQDSPVEMLKTPVFWLMYFMFILMAAGGLMATAQLAPIAKDFKIDTVPVSLLGLTLPALTFALTIDRVLNGLTRPFFGWVSDHIGREATMALAFSLEAVAILVLFAFLDDPAMFVVLTGLVFFGWGEIFSLFPSTLTDTFGPKFAATNYGFLYIAQGVGSILGGPAAAFLKQTTGSWTVVFILVACLDALTALLAITVLKTMRRRHFEAAN
jgi:OFA family oxalate/formate antiporter-like MFS transporter